MFLDFRALIKPDQFQSIGCTTFEITIKVSNEEYGYNHTVQNEVLAHESYIDHLFKMFAYEFKKNIGAQVEKSKLQQQHTTVMDGFKFPSLSDVMDIVRPDGAGEQIPDIVTDTYKAIRDLTNFSQIQSM